MEKGSSKIDQKNQEPALRFYHQLTNPDAALLVLLQLRPSIHWGAQFSVYHQIIHNPKEKREHITRCDFCHLVLKQFVPSDRDPKTSLLISQEKINP